MGHHRGNHRHSKFWNAKVASVTVTDAKGHMMEVRRIMSADQGGGCRHREPAERR
jgi:hypothetical protein